MNKRILSLTLLSIILLSLVPSILPLVTLAQGWAGFVHVFTKEATPNAVIFVQINATKILEEWAGRAVDIYLTPSYYATVPGPDDYLLAEGVRIPDTGGLINLTLRIPSTAEYSYPNGFNEEYFIKIWDHQSVAVSNSFIVLSPDIVELKTGTLYANVTYDDLYVFSLDGSLSFIVDITNFFRMHIDGINVETLGNVINSYLCFIDDEGNVYYESDLKADTSDTFYNFLGAWYGAPDNIYNITGYVREDFPLKHWVEKWRLPKTPTEPSDIKIIASEVIPCVELWNETTVDGKRIVLYSFAYDGYVYFFPSTRYFDFDDDYTPAGEATDSGVLNPYDIVHIEVNNYPADFPINYTAIYIYPVSWKITFLIDAELSPYPVVPSTGHIADVQIKLPGAPYGGEYIAIVLGNTTFKRAGLPTTTYDDRVYPFIFTYVADWDGSWLPRYKLWTTTSGTYYVAPGDYILVKGYGFKAEDLALELYRYDPTIPAYIHVRDLPVLVGTITPDSKGEFKLATKLPYKPEEIEWDWTIALYIGGTGYNYDFGPDGHYDVKNTTKKVYVNPQPTLDGIEINKPGDGTFYPYVVHTIIPGEVPLTATAFELELIGYRDGVFVSVNATRISPGAGEYIVDTYVELVNGYAFCTGYTAGWKPEWATRPEYLPIPTSPFGDYQIEVNGTGFLYAGYHLHYIAIAKLIKPYEGTPSSVQILAPVNATVEVMGFGWNETASIEIWWDRDFRYLNSTTTDELGAFTSTVTVFETFGTHTISVWSPKVNTGALYEISVIIQAPPMKPFWVKVTVGGFHFPGEVVTAYILTTFLGRPVDDATIEEVYLTYGTVTRDLKTEYGVTKSVIPGLWYVTFTVPSEAADYGDAAVYVSASYVYGITVYDADVAAFTVAAKLEGYLKDILDNVAGIKDDIIAAVETSKGEILASLGELKDLVLQVKDDIATLSSDVASIKTDVATVLELLGELKNVTLDIKGEVATIESDVLTIKANVTDVLALLGDIRVVLDDVHQGVVVLTAYSDKILGTTLEIYTTVSNLWELTGVLAEKADTIITKVGEVEQLIIKTAEGITMNITAYLPILKETLEGIADKVTEVGDKVSKLDEFVRMMDEGLTAHLVGIEDTLKTRFDDVISEIKGLGTEVDELIAGQTDTIISSLTSAMDAKLADLHGKIKADITDAATAIMDTVTKASTPIIDRIDTTRKDVLDAIAKLPDTIVKPVTSSIESLAASLGDSLKSITDSLKTVQETVKGTADTLSSTIVESKDVTVSTITMYSIAVAILVIIAIGITAYGMFIARRP